MQERGPLPSTAAGSRTGENSPRRPFLKRPTSGARDVLCASAKRPFVRPLGKLGAGSCADRRELAMTGSMKDGIEHFRAAACGLPVSRIWRGHGSALFIELGALTPRSRRDGSPGEAEGEIGLMIEWSWRIEDGQSIACGSWSDKALWHPTFARLLGRAVDDLSTFGHLPELVLSLASNLRVASFMTAEGDPAWTLFDRRGSRLIAVRCRDGMIGLDA